MDTLTIKGSDKTAAGCRCYVCGADRLQPAARYGRFETYVCQDCAHQQCWPLATPEELDYYYNNVYHHSPDRPFGTHPKFVERRYKKMGAVIRKADPSAARVFEMGCSSGYGLATLRSMGFDVAGIETSAACAEYARSFFGMDVRCGTQVPEECYGMFDCGLSFHVIEHTLSPRDHLNDLIKAVSPTGLVVLTTPNGSYFPTRYSRMWNWLEPPNHLHVFSPASFRTLLESCGLKDLRISLVVDCPELNHIAYMAAGTLAFGPRHMPSTAYDTPCKEAAPEEPVAVPVKRRLRRAGFSAATTLSLPVYSMIRRLWPAWRETILAVGRVE